MIGPDEAAGAETSRHQATAASDPRARAARARLGAGPVLSVLLIPFVGAVLGVAISFLITPTFTARASFLPPQSTQGAAGAALATVGALSGLAGLQGGPRAPADLYAALMESRTVRDRLIADFRLDKVYGVELLDDARERLANHVRVKVGRKDGTIAVEVDDESPQRAADLANRHVEELRQLSGRFALTEAQRRRVFFEAEVTKTREKLKQAQSDLQASGFNDSALRAEPKAAADAYARLRAEAMAMQVQLQTLRQALTDSAPEVQQQLGALAAINAQLSKIESNTPSNGGPEYVGRYREYRYQEALLEMFARQYELARVDEARDGVLVQDIDLAVAPLRKSKPRRSVFALTGAAAGLLISIGLLWWRARPRAVADLNC